MTRSKLLKIIRQNEPFVLGYALGRVEALKFSRKKIAMVWRLLDRSPELKLENLIFWRRGQKGESDK